MAKIVSNQISKNKDIIKLGKGSNKKLISKAKAKDENETQNEVVSEVALEAVLEVEHNKNIPNMALNLHPKHTLSIRGANVHNLKSVSVDIPKNKLVVVTGVSGSGKSSLAFNTIYAEGQRRYVESLSSYARQFLSRMEKPDVESITGLAPAVAIEQKTATKNPRSTVGTSTEVYDYLRLLYARIGKTFCKNCHTVITKDSPRTVQEFVATFQDGDRFYILFPIQKENLTNEQELERLKAKGYFRVVQRGSNDIIDLNEVENSGVQTEKAFVLIDRLVYKSGDEAAFTRIADGIETAFREGKGIAFVQKFDGTIKRFSKKFECSNCGESYKEPTVQMFSFNNAMGACKKCEGNGRCFGMDLDLVIPDKRLSINDGAIHLLTMPSLAKYKNELLKMCEYEEINIQHPFSWLTKGELDIVLNGNSQYIGVIPLIKKLEHESATNMTSRFMAAKYRGITTCPDCLGSRISQEANQVLINDMRISDVSEMSLEQALKWFKNLELSDSDKEISFRIVEEINKRLKYLNDVGIGYLTLNRLSHTLSGGESQRIALASSIGSSLVGAMYVLDEPSIGLHSRDTARLIGTLKTLRDLGNTVIVVEHDQEIIRCADFVIDMGPKAGELGGEIVASGTMSEILNYNSLTSQYLSGSKQVGIDKPKLIGTKKSIKLNGISINNIENENIEIPLNKLVAVTGVSGSGKSSIVHGALYPAIAYQKGVIGKKPSSIESISGFESISKIELIDQSPIGRSSRSNAATYIGAFDLIRDVFANTVVAKQNGWKSGYFSFNVEGGRCAACEGEGYQTVEMQFLADVKLICEGCNGRRYKSEVLNCLYNGKNIVDVLDMTVNEAIIFFEANKRIMARLKPLIDVGLGYIKLGQSATTLSGGEAQRMKIADQLANSNYNPNNGLPSQDKVLYLLDEPTTGLHFDDINILMNSFYELLKNGHSIIVVEHNLDVIKNADWIIDIGPEAGDKGGKVIFQGEVQDIIKSEVSYTGKYLKSMIENN